MKYLVIGAVAIVAILLVAAIGLGVLNINQGKEETRIITDALGRNVEVPNKVEKIVGICCGTRLLVYMESQDMIVGVEDYEKMDQTITQLPYCIPNQECFSVLPITGEYGSDPELIMDVSPDVVFAPYIDADQADSLQEQTGIPVIVTGFGLSGEVPFLDGITGFESALRLIGNVIEKQDRAEELIDYLHEIVDDLNDRTKNIPDSEKPRCYAAGTVWDGAHSLTHTNGAYSPFDLLNTPNAAAQVTSRYDGDVSSEWILQSNPDYIFVDLASYNLVMDDLNDSAYSSLTAVQQDKVYAVLPYTWYWENPETSLVVAYYIGKVLYPNAFADVNFEEKANEIYSMFDGGDILDEYSAMLGGGCQQLQVG